MDNKFRQRKLVRLLVGLVLVTSALALACDVIYPETPVNKFVLQDTDVVFQVNWN